MSFFIQAFCILPRQTHFSAQHFARLHLQRTVFRPLKKEGLSNIHTKLVEKITVLYTVTLETEIAQSEEWLGYAL